MALSLTELDAYTLKFIVPRTTDTIYQHSGVFVRLHTRNRERFGGGLQVQRPIIVGELNGDAFGKGDAFNIDFAVTDAAILFDMKGYYVNISVFGFESMRNDGELAIFSQVETKFMNAALKMGKLLATNMYLDGQSAGRTKHINGFSEAYDDGNVFTTYGGQTRSDITAVGTVGGLNSYVATITTFSLSAINTAYGAAWFGNDHVDLIPATQNGWNLIWQALQPNQRYYDKDSDVGQSGFQAFRFNAAEVIVDKYMPTGTNGVMFGLNTKYIEWFFSTNQKFQFGFTGFKEAQGSIDVAGQFLVGNQIIVPNPRSGFKVLSTLF